MNDSWNKTTGLSIKYTCCTPVGSSCCLFSSSLKDTGEFSIENLRTSEDGMGRHALPCGRRGISARTPERALFERFLSPVPRGHSDQHWCWLGWAKPQRWNTASVTMFLKSTTDPVIVFSFGIDNSIEGFTGLHVHQIHKAPHGSTTETSQMSMKSFLKDSWRI